MNYPFKEAIINYCKYGNARGFEDGVMTILEHYPKPSADMLMNFLSTHDTERILTRLAGEDVGWHDREWQAERYLSPEQYVTAFHCLNALWYFNSSCRVCRAYITAMKQDLRAIRIRSTDAAIRGARKILI